MTKSSSVAALQRTLASLLPCALWLASCAAPMPSIDSAGWSAAAEPAGRSGQPAAYAGMPASISGLPGASAASPRASSPAQESGEDAAELAKKLANPVAALVSVPFQLNWDNDVGPSDGERVTVNIQPVVPLEISEDWNLISRTILPLVHQTDVPRGEDETGLGDVVQSAFFSPKAPTDSGWIWGAGPVLLLPTASDETLGAEQLGLGPTAVALKQSGPWTYGALVNHIWRVAGEDDRPDVNATFMQPFLTYNTPDAWTFALNAESTYDWTADDLVVPVNFNALKILNFDGQLVQVGAGLRYWLDDSTTSPEGLGLRFSVVLLFPKG